MKSYLKVFSLLISSVLIANCHQHNETNDRLDYYEAANFFADRLIRQFSNKSALKLVEFERILLSIENQVISPNDTSTCVRGLEILKEIESPAKNLSGSFQVDAEHLISICPLILSHIVRDESLIDRNECVEEKSVDRESRSEVWFYSTIAIIAISLCGLFGVIVIPIVDKNYYFYVLQFFMALAVGTLTGDALLHLLPHSMRQLNEDMDRSELLSMMKHRGIAAMIGVMSFCFIEKLLKYITNMKSKDVKSDGIEDPEAEIENPQQQHHGHGHGHSHMNSQSESLSSIVWMVILGDGLHNFTDGMAVGAAFSNNIAGGFSTTVAVFCHELPHELGDFAVLLKAGMTARKAIYYNILSSVLSFFGMCVGIEIGDTPETTQWVFAAAAGLFMYIALVDMLPELMAPQKEGESFTITQSFLQLAGMCSGFAVMLLIALYEHDLENIFTS